MVHLAAIDDKGVAQIKSCGALQHYLPKSIVRVYLFVRDEGAACARVDEACRPAHNRVAFSWLTHKVKHERLHGNNCAAGWWGGAGWHLQIDEHALGQKEHGSVAGQSRLQPPHDKRKSHRRRSIAGSRRGAVTLRRTCSIALQSLMSAATGQSGACISRRMALCHLRPSCSCCCTRRPPTLGRHARARRAAAGCAR
jgi:hypothetical protein